MTRGVMIVGMHRSGTSAVTRVVNLLGVPLGQADDVYSAKDNPSGHWESRQLCALDNVILNVFGGFDIAMPPMPHTWLQSRRAARLRPVMRATFNNVYQGERWLWKDPRLCLTLPLWRQVLTDFCVVFVVRDAGQVVRSLHRREGFPRFYCYALWEEHNRRAVAALTGLPVVRVDFDSMLEDPPSQVKLLAEGLSAVGVQLNDEIGTAAASLHRSAGPDGPDDPGPGHRLATALKSGPSVSQVFRPPPLPAQPWWVRPTLRAAHLSLRTRERWTNWTNSARHLSMTARHGKRPTHNDELTAPERHQASTHAQRGMFTRDFVYMGASALQLILAALMTPVLTRSVSVSQFGQLALTMTMAQLLGPMFSFGLPFAAQKVFAGEDGDRRSRGVLAISAALAAGALLVGVLAAPAWGPAVGLNQVLYASLAAVWAACFALTLTSLAILRSRQRLTMVIFVAAVQSLGAQSTGVLFLYMWSHTVTSYLCGLILGQGIAASAGLLAVRPDWSALAAIRRYGRAFHFGLPMVPQQLSGIILYAGDRIVVRHLLGSAAVGRYAVAYNVGNLGCVLLIFVNQAWMPRIYAVADRVARSRLLASSRDTMNLLLIPVVCGLSAGAPLVLRLWAPKSFHPAELTPIVAIIAICAFPYGQFLSNLRALMSEGRTGRAAVTTLVAASTNIGLNLALVPFLRITGSAIATALSFPLLAWLSRPPASSALQVPGASRLLRILIGGAVAVTLAIGALPISSVWLVFRLVLSAGALLAFALMLRRAVAGFETSSRLVTPVVVRERHGTSRLGSDSAAALDQPQQPLAGERHPHDGGRWFRNAVELQQAKAVGDRLICRLPRRDAHWIEVVQCPRRRVGQSQRCGSAEDGAVVVSLCLLLRCWVNRGAVGAVAGFADEERTGSRKRLDLTQHGVGTAWWTVVVVVPEGRGRIPELTGQQCESLRRHARGRHRLHCAWHDVGEIRKHPGHPGHSGTIPRIDFIVQFHDLDTRIVSIAR